MPLTQSKLNHLTALYQKIVALRQQSLTLTLMQANGTTTTLTVNAVFKPLNDLDPAFDPIGHAESDLKSSDAIALFLETDITLAQLRSMVSCTVNSPVGADLVANRYIPTSVTPKGLPPGADRYLVTFDRQR